MADIKIDLDPKRVIKSLKDIATEANTLSEQIEESLGKDSVKAVDKLEKTAEAGSAKIKSHFGNLTKQIKEDMKSAFDFGRVMTGVKLGKEISEGISQIFDMEKAFARLNSRLQLSGDRLKDFKKNIGSIVANAGQKLDDILPGVDAASARGNITDPKQLSMIASTLAKARGITGEDVSSLGEEAIDILKAQGEKVTGKAISQTIDALSGARVAGSFGSASEAGAAVRDISPYGKQLGMDTRGMAGLAAVASKAGDSGQNILKQIMEKGTTVGGQQQLNAVLGQNIFKNGKLDASAIGKVDTNRFGNQAILESASGLTGANGQELKLFIDAFKDSMPQFQKVIGGSNETAKQFEIASDNFGTSIDKFKQRLINTTRSLGESIVSMGANILTADGRGAVKDIKDMGKTIAENSGTILGGIGLTAATAVLTGGGIKSLFKGMGGAGMAGGVLKGKALEQAGVTPVYVVNAAEIGGGGGLSKVGDLVKKGIGGGGIMGTLANVAPKLMKGAGIAGGVYAALRSEGAGDGEEDEVKKMYAEARAAREGGQGGGGQDLKQAIIEGTQEGMVKGQQAINKDKQTIYTNPSAYPSTGRSM